MKYVVEISSLKDLTNFIDKYGQIIIEPPQSKKGLYKIITYDSLIE